MALGAIAITAIADSSGAHYVAVVSLMVYIAAFAISLGPVPHIMMSEVFPLAVRGRGMGMASIANWGCNYIIVLLFPMLALWLPGQLITSHFG